MTTITESANSYEPTGDPEHVAYGKAFYWTCTCGVEARFLRSKGATTAKAEAHEAYCDGEATVEVAR